MHLASVAGQPSVLLGQRISRRQALAVAGAAGIGWMAQGALGQSAPGQSMPESKPSLHAYASYGWLRGFSIVPSWGARVEEAWWSYDGARMREEVALARQVHANCLRLWIEFSAWMAKPEQVTTNFLDAVAAIDEAGMKVMPCLFNRWHDFSWDYGGTYTEHLYRNWQPMVDYVKALVQPLANDPRILVWDLCNEPQAHDLASEVNQREFEWLKTIAAAVRQQGARQPITIGTMSGGNIDTFAPLCDVVCAHPYSQSQEALVAQISGYQEQQRHHAKPMLVNECIPGCLDDQRRAECARYYTQLLSAAGFGWMAWALREGKAISTRRDRYDANGLDGQGFHPFFTKEGQLRGGLEFLTEKPALAPPWQQT
ncbi:MAG: cellulase family glycosylhydrolase [Pirellulaceae bacterium]